MVNHIDNKSEEKIKMKMKSIALSMAASALMISSVQVNAGKGDPHLDKITQQPAINILNGNAVDAVSTVMRHKDSVGISFDSRGLNPGHAYTLWVMHFDKPENCNTPCGCTLADFANPDVTAGAIGGMTGRVADEYGQARLATVINYGELPTGPGQILVPNPIKDKKSELMLVLRDHGPASSDATELEQQLSSWGGGCTTNSCADTILSRHRSPYCKAGS